MKSIFKKTTGSPAPTDLVGNYQFKEHYPDVNRNMSWAELSPYIRQATRRFVLPYVGVELYDDICTKVETDAVLTTEQSDLVTFLRDAIAYHTIAWALPKKKTVVASMGAVENAGADGTTTTSLWGFKTTLWSVAQDADRLTDELLLFLEEQVKAGNPDFDIWKESHAYNDGKADIFRTTEEFQIFQNINRSRPTFLAMLPIIQQVIRKQILPIVSRIQYDQVVDQLRNNTLSDENLALLRQMQAATAAWTVYHATQKMAILPDQDGFRVIGNADAVDQRAYSSEVTTSAIERIRSAAEEDARTNTSDLIDFLQSNPEDYPIWKMSQSNPDNRTTDLPTMVTSQYGAIMV